MTEGLQQPNDRGVARDRVQRRPRVALIAYACQPNGGSEPGVGWNRVLQAARFCDLHVLTCEQDSGLTIRRHVEEHGPVLGVSFVLTPKNWWYGVLEKAPGLGYVGYHFWQRRAFRVLRRIHEECPFDLVHQLTYCGFREPGLAWKLGVPFVWGPVGGTQNCPWRFLPGLGFRAGLLEALRSVGNFLQLRFSRRVRKAARSAAIIFSASSTVRNDLSRYCAVNAEPDSDVGLESVRRQPSLHKATQEPLRILWSGRFAGSKALHLLLEALATMPPNVKYELRVLGDGPQRKRWERIARRRGIDDNINWLGWRPQGETGSHYEWANVFAFTSLRDTTGSVLLEALGAGVPVICLDHQGAADVVTDRCGVKVPVTWSRLVVEDLRSALVDLGTDRDRLHRLSQGALQRASEYLWRHHGERMMNAYRRVLESDELIWTLRDVPSDCLPRVEWSREEGGATFHDNTQLR